MQTTSYLFRCILEYHHHFLSYQGPTPLDSSIIGIFDGKERKQPENDYFPPWHVTG